MVGDAILRPTRGLVLDDFVSDETNSARWRDGVVVARVTPRMLRALADEPDAARRALAAGHERLDRRTMLRLARDRAPAVRAAIASNPKLLTDVALTLATDSSVTVRLALAASAGLAPQAAAVLAGDADPEVPLTLLERDLAGNSEVLLRLAQHPDASVREALYSGTNMRVFVALHVAQEGAVDARVELAECTTARGDVLTDEVLTLLCTNPDVSVRQAGLHALALQVAPADGVAIAARPNAVKSLMTDPVPALRMEVADLLITAEHSDAVSERLATKAVRTMATDEDFAVRAWVAWKTADRKALKLLIHDPDPRVRNDARANPNAPRSASEQARGAVREAARAAKSAARHAHGAGGAARRASDAVRRHIARHGE